MEGHKVVSATQNKEEINKRCHLGTSKSNDERVKYPMINISDKSENGNTNSDNITRPELSKSKKRRLRKRHLCNTQSLQENRNCSINLELEPNFAVQNSLSIDKLGLNEESINSVSEKRVCIESKRSDSEKEETIGVPSDGNYPSQPLDNTKSNRLDKEKSKYSTSIEEVNSENNIFLNKIGRNSEGGGVMEGEKCKHEILTERKARKQAKLAVKNKKMSEKKDETPLANKSNSYDVPDGTITRIISSTMVKKDDINTGKHPSDKKNKIQANVSEKSDNIASSPKMSVKSTKKTSESSEVKKDLVVKSKLEAHTINSKADMETIEKLKPEKSIEEKLGERKMKGEQKIAGVMESEKSRHEILAEREARKQAKLVAKNKKMSEKKDETPLAKESNSYDVPDGTITRIISSTMVKKDDINTEKNSSGRRTIQANVSEKSDNTASLSSSPKMSDRNIKMATESSEVKKGIVAKSKTDEAHMINRMADIKTKGKLELVRSMEEELGEGKMKGEQKSAEVKASNEKSKAELRAERRAKQEAQRAAKIAEKQQKAAAVTTIHTDNKVKEKKKPHDVERRVPAIKKKGLNKEKKTEPTMNSLRLFSHLHYDTKPPTTLVTLNVHPAIVKLGVKYSSKVISGSNARCVAFLQALKMVINDYTTPGDKEFSRGLEEQLAPVTGYLNRCRPLSVSMINALRHLKSHLNQLPNNIQDDEARSKLCDVIDTYIKEQIDVAQLAICKCVKEKIANGDVILIYACSSLLYEILVESHKAGTKFSVVIVDSAPWFEGREMLRRLVSQGLKCTYVLISAISFIMRQATKVLLGAHALLANGYVMSRAGCALVALVAHWNNVPVLVCCETYKFCERVQTDAFVFNELGSIDDIAPANSALANHKNLAYLSPLSILYDVTPPDLVTAVVTEVAILPCTSVPVILRVKPSDVAS